MRQIKFTGREANIVRAIGFTEPVTGVEIQEFTRMEAEDVTDALNSLISAGFVESVPYREQIEMAAMPGTMFELNPGYVHEIKAAFNRR
ncbi:MAG: hypothetical protein ABIR71_04505 [Chthoniobacterales bacterium]